MENQDTGLLLHDVDIKLHRAYFEEMTQLIGIITLFRKPKNKNYDRYGEIDSNYEPPISVGCIFDEHPNQWTTKKLGWNHELSEDESIIHVPYDLEGLQIGAIFIIPSGIDKAVGRVFKVIEMSTISIYPASIACKIGPVFENNFARDNLHDFRNSDFNILHIDEEDD